MPRGKRQCQQNGRFSDLLYDKGLVSRINRVTKGRWNRVLSTFTRGVSLPVLTSLDQQALNPLRMGHQDESPASCQRSSVTRTDRVTAQGAGTGSLIWAKPLRAAGMQGTLRLRAEGCTQTLGARPPGCAKWSGEPGATMRVLGRSCCSRGSLSWGLELSCQWEALCVFMHPGKSQSRERQAQHHSHWSWAITEAGKGDWNLGFTGLDSNTRRQLALLGEELDSGLGQGKSQGSLQPLE